MNQDSISSTNIKLESTFPQITESTLSKTSVESQINPDSISSTNIKLESTHPQITETTLSKTNIKSQIASNTYSTFLKLESTNPKTNEFTIPKTNIKTQLNSNSLKSTYPKLQSNNPTVIDSSQDNKSTITKTKTNIITQINSISSIIDQTSLIKDLISSIPYQNKNSTIQNIIPEKTVIQSTLINKQSESISNPTKTTNFIATSLINNNIFSIIKTQEIIKTTILENNPDKSNIFSSDSINNIPNTSLNSKTNTFLSDETDSINIPITNLKSQIINSHILTTDEMTNIPEAPTTLIDNIPAQEVEKIIYTIFILQVQLINNILKVFILSDFPIPKNYSMKLNTMINYKNIRNLQQEKGKNVLVTVYATEDSDKDKITVLSSDNEFNKENNIKRVEVQEIEIDNKDNNELNINLLDNDCLDSSKVENKINNKEIVDYSEISPNYKVYQYKINSASKGCNFNLESSSNINKQDKEINLNFKNDKSEFITANCTLSKNNENSNSIPCTLDKNVDSNYFLADYIESNDEETLTIMQSNKSNKLHLNCHLGSEKDDKLKTGAIIGIVICIVFLASGLIIAIVLAICKKPEGRLDNGSTFKSRNNNLSFENSSERKIEEKKSQ